MENKTDFFTLSMLKEMMAIQDSAFRASTQLIIENIRSEMKTIKKEFEISVRFTSDEYDDVSEKMKKMDAEISAVYRQIDMFSNNMDREIEKLEDKHDYIENHSLRNNNKIMGVQETNEEKTWEDTEKVVQKLFQEKLGIFGRHRNRACSQSQRGKTLSSPSLEPRRPSTSKAHCCQNFIIEN